MRVYIDARERTLCDILGSLKVSYVSRALDIGDIDILGPIGQRFLLERKTLSDLASSLRDGRFKNQKDRLVGVLQREPATAVAYVIEGHLGSNNAKRINGRVTIGSLRSLINTIQFRYRIPVITVRNIRETGELIAGIVQQLNAKPDWCPIGSGENGGCAGYADLLPKIVHNTKDDNGSLWCAMLTAVRGISKKSASIIVSHFEVIQPGGIIEFVRNSKQEEFTVEMQKIRNNGRRLSNKILSRIISLFYPDEDGIVGSRRSSSPDENIRTSHIPGLPNLYVSRSRVSSATKSDEEIPKDAFDKDDSTRN